MKYLFKKAVPVWGSNLKNNWNQFLGFITTINLKEKTRIHISIAARSFYRMYINGEMFSHGPAQTGHGYARVDQLDITITGMVTIAFEVVSYNKPDRYSNDITLEPGMFCCEITKDNQVLAATGSEENYQFYYKELTYRKPLVELLSHSREIMEVYSLSEKAFNWRIDTNGMDRPVVLKVNIPTFLTRRAPYANYYKRQANKLIKIADSLPFEGEIKPKLEPVLFMQGKWYSMLADKIVPKVMLEGESLFTGKLNTEIGWKVFPGKLDACLVWELGESVVGFPELILEVTEDTILDLLHSDNLDDEGKPRENSCMVRFQLEPGHYHLICFEPYNAKYLKVIIRSKGSVHIKYIGMIDYMFPDQEKGTFFCSDGELNLIFEGARRTLRNNTLDIFMDCPERERGGWLCDSLWTARASWMLFGDLSVEKDFLENFLMTEADRYQFSFFPEVYPGNKGNEKDPGIMSWSFWLAMELCEYYHRSGDLEFIDRFRGRLEQFVDGILSFKGESELLENIPNLFVDWSDSNYSNNLYPISVPINLLAANVLKNLGELYSVNRWKEEGGKIQNKLLEQSYLMHNEIEGAFTDAVSFRDGQLIPGQGMTEAGIALELWSGFGNSPGKQQLVKAFVEQMGTCPKKKPKIQISRSNLFIGLAIRHDVLSRLGEVELLVNELKDVYLPQMLQGPGTLYEGLFSNGFTGSLDHGFNSHAGVLLMRDVLGIGEPSRLNNTVRIAPHLVDLCWASGKVDTGDGEISLSWRANYEEKKFVIDLSLPEGWNADILYPEIIKGWKIILNGES